MVTCFCRMVDQRKVFGQPYFQPGPLPFSPLQISDTPRAGFEFVRNLSSCFVERSCAVMITTILRCHSTLAFHGILIVFRSMFPFNYVIGKCFQIHIKRTPLGSQNGISYEKRLKVAVTTICSYRGRILKQLVVIFVGNNFKTDFLSVIHTQKTYLH